jgi:hypothetical protein
VEKTSSIKFSPAPPKPRIPKSSIRRILKRIVSTYQSSLVKKGREKTKERVRDKYNDTLWKTFFVSLTAHPLGGKPDPVQGRYYLMLYEV